MSEPISEKEMGWLELADDVTRRAAAEIRRLREALRARAALAPQPASVLNAEGRTDADRIVWDHGFTPQQLEGWRAQCDQWMDEEAGALNAGAPPPAICDMIENQRPLDADVRMAIGNPLDIAVSGEPTAAVEERLDYGRGFADGLIAQLRGKREEIARLQERYAQAESCYAGIVRTLDESGKARIALEQQLAEKTAECSEHPIVIGILQSGIRKLLKAAGIKEETPISVAAQVLASRLQPTPAAPAAEDKSQPCDRTDPRARAVSICGYCGEPWADHGPAAPASADGERIEWLEAESGKLEYVDSGDEPSHWLVYCDAEDEPVGMGPTVREAIDAARAKAPSHD